MNYHTVSWDSDHKANKCYRCGSLSFGVPKTGGYDECIECKKIHLMEVQNEILRDQEQRLSEKQSNSSSESNGNDNTAIKNAIAIFVLRIFLVFLLWDWILPKKISDAAGFFAVSTILFIGKFFPQIPYLAPNSKKSWVAHWIVFFILGFSLIEKLWK